ncbi:hypothetical protein C8J56DRAFT_879909 [Mycena floridula]|nr:hypothetical protein C8J56DRAFT_879909 [Mycena floridula]
MRPAILTLLWCINLCPQDGSFYSGASICPDVELQDDPGPFTMVMVKRGYIMVLDVDILRYSFFYHVYLGTDHLFTGTPRQPNNPTQDPSLPQSYAAPSKSFIFISITISTGFATGSSTISDGPSISSYPANKLNNVPIIAGCAIGSMVVIAAIIGALIIIQRRRCTRMLNLNISRYEPSRTENTGIRPAIFTRKQYMNIDDSTENIDGSSGAAHDRQIRSEKDPAAFNPVTFPQGQVADSEAVLNDISPEFTRALMTENIRLNAENQALRDLNRSDWTRGLTNVAPPSYPHSEAYSL